MDHRNWNREGQVQCTVKASASALSSGFGHGHGLPTDSSVVIRSQSFVWTRADGPTNFFMWSPQTRIIHYYFNLQSPSYCPNRCYNFDDVPTLVCCITVPPHPRHKGGCLGPACSFSFPVSHSDNNTILLKPMGEK